MSYNILKKNVKFSGPVSGTIEGMVDTSTNQTIGGQKTFSHTITSSADVMVSGSGKVSASFYYGDGSNLSGLPSGVGGSNTQVQFNNNNNHGGSADFTFATGSSTMTVRTGSVEVLSASNYVSASAYYGDASNLTNIAADSVLAQNIVGQLSASQISTSVGLTSDSNNLAVNLATKGGITDSSGLSINISDLNEVNWSSDGEYIAIDRGGTTKKIALTELEDNLTINASNIDNGTINNARLPNAISASVGISSSFFQGDGSGLTNVTSAPTPTGSNTEIQFNADGILGATTSLTFLTGSNTLATSNISASVNISGSSLYLQDEIIVGGQAFLDINANVAANNASFVEITASSTISSSADVYGANFRGNGSTLNNVPLGSSNAASIVFVNNETNKTITTNAGFTFNGTHAVNTGGGFKGTTLSASADLQVGGHITGSGDVVLGGTMYWDRTGTGINTGPKLTPGGSPTANSLNIDGDSIITIQADTNARFRVGDASTPDLILDITPTVVSSSVPITGSALHTNGGITIATGGGDITFLSDQGNVTAGSIEMLAGGSDVLNFNDNSISGSGNISGSAFYGDGSNLTNIPAGSPAGANTQIQLNADGAFGASSKFTFATSSATLEIAKSTTTSNAAKIFFASGSDGSGSFITSNADDDFQFDTGLVDKDILFIVHPTNLVTKNTKVQIAGNAPEKGVCIGSNTGWGTQTLYVGNCTGHTNSATTIKFANTSNKSVDLRLSSSNGTTTFLNSTGSDDFTISHEGGDMSLYSSNNLNLSASNNLNLSASSNIGITGSTGLVAEFDSTSDYLFKARKLHYKEITFQLASSLSGGDVVWLPMGGTLNDIASQQYYTKFIAPFDGEIVKVMMRADLAAGGGSYTLKSYKASNATEHPTTLMETESILLNSTANTTRTANFTTSTFSAGDVLGFDLTLPSPWSPASSIGVNATIVIAYDELS
jgi:hypothetical protein